MTLDELLDTEIRGGRYWFKNSGNGTVRKFLTLRSLLDRNGTYNIQFDCTKYTGTVICNDAENGLVVVQMLHNEHMRYGFKWPFNKAQ